MHGRVQEYCSDSGPRDGDAAEKNGKGCSTLTTSTVIYRCRFPSAIAVLSTRRASAAKRRSCINHRDNGGPHLCREVVPSGYHVRQIWRNLVLPWYSFCTLRSVIRVLRSVWVLFRAWFRRICYVIVMYGFRLDLSGFCLETVCGRMSCTRVQLPPPPPILENRPVANRAAGRFCFGPHNAESAIYPVTSRQVALCC